MDNPKDKYVKAGETVKIMGSEICDDGSGGIVIGGYEYAVFIPHIITSTSRLCLMYGCGWELDLLPDEAKRLNDYIDNYESANKFTEEFDILHDEFLERNSYPRGN